MRSSLSTLKLGLKGDILMSTQLDEMQRALNINKVPSGWEKFAYVSMKPLASWINDLVERINFFKIWIT